MNKKAIPPEEIAVSEPPVEETVIKETVSAPKDRFLPASILIAAVLISGAVIFSALYRGGGAAPAPGGNGETGGQPTVSAADIMKIGPRDEVLGNANAPVTIVEYGDYQCPFCSSFFKNTQPEIVANYVNSGKVRMVFRDFPFLGPESNAAGAAAECAFDQGKLWAYHDALYQSKVADEAKGGGENDGSYSPALFLTLAQKVGLNIPAFSSCLNSNKHANEVAQAKTAASAAGVNSTPTFFVNGAEVMGAQPYAAFKTAIDAALKG